MTGIEPNQQARPEAHPTHTRHATVGSSAMRLKADVVALIYIGFIAAAARQTGVIYILFPELAALSWDVMERPQGHWASAPLLLVISPPITGLFGTVITRTMPYGFASVMLTVAACVVIIRALRSPIAPAIAAGLLPLVLGVTTWWYPTGIFFGTTLLAIVSILWKRYGLPSPLGHTEPAGGPPDDVQRTDLRVSAATRNTADAAVEPTRNIPKQHIFVALLAFVAIAMGAVKLTGMRFILFPPLVVILYEMLSHREHCPWVGRPVGVPLACFLAATGGYICNAHIAFTPIAAMLSMAWGVVLLRVLKIHMPPVLAVALLPIVIAHPTAAYPLAVGFGTIMVSVWYALFGRWRASRPTAAEKTSAERSALDTVV
jgi:hypothetical protein